MIYTLSAFICLAIPLIAVGLAGALGLKHGVVYLNYPGVRILSKSGFGSLLNAEIIKISLVWALIGLTIVASIYLMVSDGVFAIYGILALNIISISVVIIRLGHYVRVAVKSSQQRDDT